MVSVDEYATSLGLHTIVSLFILLTRCKANVHFPMLSGVGKEAARPEWSARMKVALRVARGLAYLHGDSSTCVMHGDFKASNTLLEHDFTPKVSDFGLARTNIHKKNRRISMGTFGLGNSSLVEIVPLISDLVFFD